MNKGLGHLYATLKKLLHTLKGLISDHPSSKEFNSYYYKVLLDRLKMVSQLLILTYPFYFYLDFIALNKVEDVLFRYTLTSIHISGLVISILYLFLFRYWGIKGNWLPSKWKSCVIHFYITSYVFMGALASINSQRLTGNIDAYVIILISVAALFPMRLSSLAMIFIVNHIFFISSLSLTIKDEFSLLTKQVNTTATMGIALIIGVTFYVYKRKDYDNQLKLIQYATTDELTGVINRRYGIELLQTNLEKAKKEECKLSVCFIDINGLKKVNDRYGHYEGDYLIKKTCESIQSGIDSKDILFRLAGDEFVIIFIDKSLSEMEDNWNKIEHEIKRTNTTLHKPYTLSFSYGMFHYEKGMAINVEEILEIADLQMYKQKRRNTNNRIVRGT